ncbi:hypothetical protein ACFE04_004710 [Oxalis oulophora]
MASADDVAKHGFDREEMYSTNLAGTTKVTICGGGEGVDGDVYVFPDNVKYKLQEEIDLRGLGSEVFVSPCSHVGGHKYAGNLIIVTPDSEGKSICNWYGYVTPDDVPELLDNHIAKGEIIERLWRGKMGPAAEEGETGEVQEVPSGQEADKSVKLNGESNVQVSNIATGCCGGANGVACCQDPIPETNGDKDTEEVHEKKGQDKVSVLGRQFEQHEIITAAAVVGTLATVAIAYGIYRRSG